MAISSIPATSGPAPAKAQAPVTPIDQALGSQLAQAPSASASSAAAPSDSVQLSTAGLSLASQLFDANGSLNMTAAKSVLQQSIDSTLFSSLGAPDSAQFSSIAMMLSGAGSTAASSGSDVSALFQLAAQSQLVSGMPKNLTPTQFSQFLPTLAAQIPNFSALVSPTAAPASGSSDSSVKAVSDV